MVEEPVYIFSGEFPKGTQIRYLLTGERLTVGRNGDISLREPSVSREHAVLSRGAGGVWFVSDAGSRNGTFVNGISVQRKALVVGDVVKFGKVALRLEDPNAEGGGFGDMDETRAMTMGSIEPSATRAPDGPGARALVGRSEALRNAMKLAARAAKSNATVLICGESGTGKELFARLVWEESARSRAKFLPVHSGAIEPTLLADALFGHEKGAFTGADRQRKGLFEEADGGTIFLDEIGEINADTQVKLLRVLQEGEFIRVGGTTPVKVDVRVICATNRDLAAAVREGRFREDLYYRLNVIQIRLTPLRDRPGDVSDLVVHYVKELGGATRSVSKEAMEALCRYSWPGNVRELRNTIERMVILADHNELGMDDLPPEVRDCMETADEHDGGGMGFLCGGIHDNAPQTHGVEAQGGQNAAPHKPQSDALADLEHQHILSVLDTCGGNKKLAAERLGISRSTLYEKLKDIRR